jgi:site-specific DNA-methyltransferase (adenine-specific)
LAGSDHGDIILDPFAGAMTTLLAAKQLNRQAIGIELNESYIKAGTKRLEQEYLQFKEAGE